MSSLRLQPVPCVAWTVCRHASADARPVPAAPPLHPGRGCGANDHRHSPFRLGLGEAFSAFPAGLAYGPFTVSHAVTIDSFAVQGAWYTTLDTIVAAFAECRHTRRVDPPLVGAFVVREECNTFRLAVVTNQHAASLRGAGVVDGGLDDALEDWAAACHVTASAPPALSVCDVRSTPGLPFCKPQRAVSLTAEWSASAGAARVRPHCAMPTIDCKLQSVAPSLAATPSQFPFTAIRVVCGRPGGVGALSGTTSLAVTPPPSADAARGGLRCSFGDVAAAQAGEHLLLFEAVVDAVFAPFVPPPMAHVAPFLVCVPCH